MALIKYCLKSRNVLVFQYTVDNRMKWTLEFVSTPTNWQVLHLQLSESSYSLDFFVLRLVTVHNIAQ